MDTLPIPVVTFLRVFDTDPFPEVLDLPRLVAGLRRFECKPDIAQSIGREVARITRARDELAAGREPDGHIAVRLARALAAGGIAGLNAEADYLCDDARKEAKKALRIWTPAVYAPGAKRGGDGVVAMSCLVLDYDHGVTPEDAQFSWEPWFHVLHSTWSHRDTDPRFRVILPLARLVAPLDWPAVWKWASGVADGRVDPAGKGVASTFALPAVPGPEAPRLFRVNAGPFLDPADEGLPLRPCSPPLPTPAPGASHFARADVVKHEFVEAGS